uniref:Nanos-type domain-containing protein n=1 Tax=Anopheles atroparvus TaxID=41427 RepID=A0AAG5DG47_ANOAO
MNAIEYRCAYATHYIDGQLVDDLWHKIFPDGAATIEFALSVQLGSKFGAIMPTGGQELFFDTIEMAKDFIQPIRNMDAIREEFLYNGTNDETDYVLPHVGAINDQGYTIKQMKQCRTLTKGAVVSDTGLSQTLPGMDDVRAEYAYNGTNDVAYDCVLSQDGAKYAAGHEIKQKNQRRPLSNVTNVNGASFLPNSHTTNPKRSVRERRSSEAEYCVFCYNNGTTAQNYKSHLCRDDRGLVSCPILQKMVCPHCNATGVYAHTPKYCPQKPIITPEDCEAIEQHHLRKAQGRRRSFASNPTGKENASAEASAFKQIFTHKTYIRQHCNISEDHRTKPQSQVSVRM